MIDLGGGNIEVSTKKENIKSKWVSGEKLGYSLFLWGYWANPYMLSESIGTWYNIGRFKM